MTKAERNAYNASYRAIHKAERAAYDVAYQRSHKAEIKARKAVYGKTHRAEDRARQKVYIDRKYEIMVQAKSKPCMDCGGRFHPCAMDFDHVRGKKLFTVGENRNRGISTIKEEIAKCDVVCSNCHRVRTWSRAHRSKS